jgi:hypothetical protein
MARKRVVPVPGINEDAIQKQHMKVTMKKRVHLQVRRFMHYSA